MAFVLGPAISEGTQKAVRRYREALLDLHVADDTAPISFLQLVDLLDTRVESVVTHEHRIAFHVAGISGTEAPGIGEHATHLLAHRLLVVVEEDRVAERLAHLRATIRAYEAWDSLDEGFQLGENLAHGAVKPPRVPGAPGAAGCSPPASRDS